MRGPAGAAAPECRVSCATSRRTASGQDCHLILSRSQIETGGRSISRRRAALPCAIPNLRFNKRRVMSLTLAIAMKAFERVKVLSTFL
jgi:hypothetical protein